MGRSGKAADVGLEPDSEQLLTEPTVSGIRPSTTEAYAGMEPDFSKATKGTLIYWDDMDLVS